MAYLCYDGTMRVFWLTIILCMSSVWVWPCLAQSESKPQDDKLILSPGERAVPQAPDFFSYFFQPQYNQMVRTAVLTWPKPFNFRQMRAMYSRTRQYDPLGEGILKKLSDLSYAIETDKDPASRDRKFGVFQGLVLDHLGNIDVVLQALAMARRNSGYGDSGFYEWVVKGTETEILMRRHGRSIKDSYVLITMADEALIFNRLGVKSTYAELVSDGKRFYYIHLAENLKTHEQFELYTDASIPMRVLKARHNDTETPKPLNLPKN